MASRAPGGLASAEAEVLAAGQRCEGVGAAQAAQDALGAAGRTHSRQEGAQTASVVRVAVARRAAGRWWTRTAAVAAVVESSRVKATAQHDPCHPGANLPPAFIGPAQCWAISRCCARRRIDRAHPRRPAGAARLSGLDYGQAGNAIDMGATQHTARLRRCGSSITALPRPQSQVSIDSCPSHLPRLLRENPPRPHSAGPVPRGRRAHAGAAWPGRPDAHADPVVQPVCSGLQRAPAAVPASEARFRTLVAGKEAVTVSARARARADLSLALLLSLLQRFNTPPTRHLSQLQNTQGRDLARLASSYTTISSTSG
ncbi:hypothetical protein T440DRAFT_171942 [Plenodomus tracheiphilus IPT5]|uniref:Uncharacterized protein n=1 Tax=Plenodomus tracheiphilus IPT5 TaxID=1408161 RepID=A0A6A7B195_9PLEO|nr:hypothetical protein T440DRAFT_171942 [Plenodomus tracheiphilus IPT5]